MDNKDVLQEQVGLHMKKIVDIVNGKENNAEKAVLLKQLRSAFLELNGNIGENINYVAKKTIEDFFRTNSQYKDFLALIERGSGCWQVLAFGIPICVVSCTSKEVGFYSMDSIRDEFDRFEKNHQKDAEKVRKSYQKANDILALSDWQFFLRDLKRRSFLSPAMILKGRKSIQKARKALFKELSSHEGKYRRIHCNKDSLVSFINTISSYLYSAFEKGGYRNNLKDIESYCYDFDSAVSLFMKKGEYQGKGLSVQESEEYSKSEKLSAAFI